ncbi:MAG TPA: exosortase B [Burkholderiaceae bacterium]|nr:exosortase B [Burkholderiaceae bacterium]
MSSDRSSLPSPASDVQPAQARGDAPLAGAGGNVVRFSRLSLNSLRHDRLVVTALILGAALAVMFLPVFEVVAVNVWSTDEQGHGPIILAVSAWLLWHRREKLREAALLARPGGALAWAVFAFGAAMYMVGRIQNIVMFEMASLLPLVTAAMALGYGWRVARAAAFPIFFLVFAVPLPGAVVDMLTQPLKQAVSFVAEQLLYRAGYPISRTGVILMVGQYQLLVADACAGLNSMFTLEALGLLYLNVMGHTSKLRNLLLAILIIPVSFCANVVRVCLLVLITFYFGDEAGQGFVHTFAGMVLFLVGLTLMLGVDKVLGSVLPAEEARA